VSQPPLLIDGTELEIFEKDILGRGAHGILYRGRERTSSKDVAVRVLDGNAPAAATSLLATLRRHADALAPLEAEGIVPVLSSGEWRGKIYYAMDLVQGESLASCIGHANRFTTDEIIHIAEGIAGGLKAACKGGLAPCGLKPSNVFITTNGSLRMADVGLAHCLAEPLELPMARWQGRYVSPEQISGDPADVRSDLYSLGVMLYELATRKLPFEGYDSTTSFYYQLLHVDPAPPRELGASIPHELERVILRCLDKAPADRYQGPDALLKDLEAVRRRQHSSSNLAGLPEDDSGDFDIYEDQVIGEGGMGILYRARQRSLGRPVAVKVIRGMFTASPEFVQRFRQEAELLAQVNHANVVQVFGTGTWHGRLFYAMELVEGQDVASRLREKLRFDSEDVLRVAEGVARALSAAWRFRIVHRDIKPSNILLTPEGSIKVADFGLAKSLRITKSDSCLIAGTSEYISPEQGMGKAVDIRSDIYSLGVVLYELLMGRPPFKSDGAFTFVVYQHVHVTPPALEPIEGGPAIPVPVKEIIQKCLEKKPESRYQTPEELLSAIVNARASVRSAAPVTARDAAESSSRGRAWVRRVRPSALLLTMLAGAACMLFAALHRPAPLRRPVVELEVLLGIGDFPEALKLAEQHWGKTSSEYEEAALRMSESLRQETETRAREAVRLRDWSAAADGFQRALASSNAEHTRELRAALQLSRDLARARELEENRRPAEALELYRLHAGRVPSLNDYLRERISGVQEAIDKASNKPR
jgi:serine/threonine protein kinase